MDGDPVSAARTLAEQGDVPRNYFWLTVVQVQAEVAAGLELADRCERLFDELLPFRGRVGITASGSFCFGLVSRSLGELALALGRNDEAIALLTEAVRDADGIGLPFEAVRARRLLASAYQARGEVARAEKIIDEALCGAQYRGFNRELALLRARWRPDV